MAPDDENGTDDVSGAAVPLADVDAPDEQDDPFGGGYRPGPDAAAPAPAQVEELARAGVRFVTARYGVALDYQPETLSLVDQWVRDARSEIAGKPEALELAQAAVGAYLGEVVRRWFGARWVAEGDHRTWRLCLSNVHCATNPIGMAREALTLAPAEGWSAHLEVEAADRPAMEARLEALPHADDDEYYAPTTRFDVLCIVVDALRASMRARGLGDRRLSLEDYR